MEMNYLKIQDEDRIAWYSSNLIDSIAKGAALLSKATDAAPDPDVSTMEQCAGNRLRPISHDEYAEGLRDLAYGRGSGMVAEIDLAADKASFTFLNPLNTDSYTVSASASRIAGVFDLAMDRKTGMLDGDEFVSNVIRHCCVESVISPTERFVEQEQEPPSGQGMTMQ